MLSFFPRGVLDEILNLIESVSEGFPSYTHFNAMHEALSSLRSTSIGETRRPCNAACETKDWFGLGCTLSIVWCEERHLQ